MEEVLMSAGIDIGTSTTQLIFSKLKIQNLASDFSVPRIEIIDKTIVYRSRIYMTPLIDGDVIDGEGIRKIIENEYAAAGVKKEILRTGAVIITGETAAKRNAKEIVLQCSDFAGDFVVATAGPDLESIISGKGAGAEIYSKENHTTIVHLDIGGGTSNLSVFVNGTAMDCGCLDIGGRILKVDETQKIIYISKKLEILIQRHQWHIEKGMRVEADDLKPVIDLLVGILEMSVGLKEKTEDYDLMVTNHGLEKGIDAESISFSGGVAEYIYQNENVNESGKKDDRKTMPDDFLYGDIGVLLGEAIRNSRLFHSKTVYESQEKIRATVVGAGSHTTKISGSTVMTATEVLPQKNVPIIKIETHEEFTGDEINVSKIQEAIVQKSQWYDEQETEQPAAIAFEGVISPTFHQVQQYADAITKAVQETAMTQMVSGETPMSNGINRKSAEKKPLIIVTREDMGKVLGQCLRVKLGKSYPVICLDGIELAQGDYIDIGLPAAAGMVVPVVVKTLVFHA